MPEPIAEEQIEKLAGKSYKQWFDGALKGGTEEDHKAAAAWLGPRQSTLVKSMGDIDSAIKEYLLVGKERRASGDPDAVKHASAVDKALTVATALLADFRKGVKWPHGSKLFGALDAEIKSIETTRMVLRRRTADGAILDSDGTGKKLTPRDLGRGAPRAEADHAETLLRKFEQERAAAREAKALYTKHKLDAKAAFLEYEAWVRKVKPDYQTHKIDWENGNAWEQIAEDPVLLKYLTEVAHGGQG